MSELPRQHGHDASRNPLVMKLGGSSIEDAGAIRRSWRILESRLSLRPVVIVSALAGVTDQLLTAGKAAARRSADLANNIFADVHFRHAALARELVAGTEQENLLSQLNEDFNDMQILAQDLTAAGEFTPATQDHLMGLGECISSKLVCAAFQQAGLAAVHVDARSCIVTDDRHTYATPLWELTNENLRRTLVPLLQSGQVPLMAGFIGSTREGVPTTLGRGGSDFSAAIVGGALHASRVEIWTDVDGVMTTDPKVCPDARVIARMSFDEASEMACFGAKVLHPATLLPAMRENIPVHVLNARNPQGEGTQIVAHASTTNVVTAVTAKRKVAAVEIETWERMNVELLGAICAVFDQHRCPIDVMVTSLGRVSLLVGSTSPLPGVAADLEGVAKVRWENHKALICLVGENIRRQPEVASRVFAAISDLDVRLSCQGASDRTITFLVEDSKADESVQRLHRLFFPEKTAPKAKSSPVLTQTSETQPAAR